jgi:hypothetical protein
MPEAMVIYKPAVLPVAVVAALEQREQRLLLRLSVVRVEMAPHLQYLAAASLTREAEAEQVLAALLKAQAVLAAAAQQ